MIQNNEKFLVLTKNKNGETFSIPTKQRALILQGGGALGYYEIGVLQSICEHLFNNTESRDRNDKANDGHFFDIIAGVSIGAINAVFLVDHVLKNNGKWDRALKYLKSY